MNICQGCKLDFGSVAAFDAHRVGKHEYLYREGLDMEPPRYDGRRCLDEDEIEAAVNSAGRSLFGKNSRGTISLEASLNFDPKSLSGELCTPEDA